MCVLLKAACKGGGAGESNDRRKRRQGSCAQFVLLFPRGLLIAALFTSERESLP